jgi:hypothetical protein
MTSKSLETSARVGLALLTALAGTLFVLTPRAGKRLTPQPRGF